MLKIQCMSGLYYKFMMMNLKFLLERKNAIDHKLHVIIHLHKDYTEMRKYNHQ